MKITVYNIKGSTGKTPISTNIAFDKHWAIATNESYHILDKIFPPKQVLSVSSEKKFPKLPSNVNIIFDLGGFIELVGDNIISAIEQSDVVIIPVYNEYKALASTLHTIKEVREINNNILLIATKLEKSGFGKKWTESEDFLNIKQVIKKTLGVEYPILPLKKSKVFDNIFKQKKSIRQICEESAFRAHSYRDVKNQFEDIYKYLDKNYD